jgi:hypothetical protein
VIVANHLGENLIPALVAGGAAAGPALLVVVAHLFHRVSRLSGAVSRRRGSGPNGGEARP